MKFEWDEKKNNINKIKHNIGFEDAIEIFENYRFSIVDNRFDYGEIREISIGKTNNQIVIVVVHTDRNGKTRIISVRKANKKEKFLYNQHLEKQNEES